MEGIIIVYILETISKIHINFLTRTFTTKMMDLCANTWFSSYKRVNNMIFLVVMMIEKRCAESYTKARAK